MNDRSAIVTGSTSGIGPAIAQALARAGTNVMLNGFGDAEAIETLRGSFHDMPEERVIREVILASQPNKRFVELEQLGALVLYLCSDAAGSMTGAALPIEGGWTAR